ncbi:hypothetical protein [Peribacillus frigoritolerans]|uniref:hypothetical protein n=1 Tax=Peribacillus frigoritolerans TaxID=450367 RepID=UPI00203B7899|nr:hypothetical protein [Peribacillus frigoritolerans]MCM3167461.1 hypothetical protein [Peribacillus frigoritolerans]
MPGSFKISSHQLMILILLYSVGTVILHTPSPLAGFASRMRGLLHYLEQESHKFLYGFTSGLEIYILISL